jgi:glycosyltransferase involved in cell wall biosynthesis
VASVVAQDVPEGLEVIVVDGLSTDGTAGLAAAAGAKVIDNPERVIPAALNRGLAAARGSVIVRFDAHAEMPPGYVRACLRALDAEPGAANVGGWREARGTGPWGEATARVLPLPVGVGNSRIWRKPAAGAGRSDVDTVPLGCFPSTVLRQAGGWREDMLANEDFELNHRLRSTGGRVVFDPAVWSVYRPRESWQDLARQYWNYGRWKAETLKLAPGSVRPRQLAPPALALTTLVALVPASQANPARWLLGGYLLALAGVAARVGWRAAPVLATMHLAWGTGLLRGLASRRRA